MGAVIAKSYMLQGSAHDLVPIAKTYPLFREYIRKKDGTYAM